jgi:hypothetical protein
LAKAHEKFDEAGQLKDAKELASVKGVVTKVLEIAGKLG